MIALAAIGLCSCKDAKTAAEVNSIFRCKFEGEYKQTELKGAMTSGEDAISFRFTSPETLSGIEIESGLQSEQMRLRLGDMEIDFDESKYPESAFARLVAKIIARVGREGASPESRSDKQGRHLAGTVDGIEYTVTLDESSNPVEIVLPDYALKLALYDFE